MFLTQGVLNTVVAVAVALEPPHVNLEVVPSLEQGEVGVVELVSLLLEP